MPVSYMNRDDRRSSIVRATVDIALADGLSAATVRAVAKAIDASPGQIHHHFASASESRAEAFSSAVRQAAPIDTPSMSLKDRLLLHLTGRAEGQAVDRQITALWNEGFVVAAKDPVVGAAIRGLTREWIDRLSEIVEEARAAG